MFAGCVVQSGRSTRYNNMATDSKTSPSGTGSTTGSGGSGSGSESDNGSFTFHAIGSGSDGKSVFSESFDKREIRSLLDKWNVSGQLCVRKFRYEQNFDTKNAGNALTNSFLSDLLNSDAFRSVPGGTIYDTERRRWVSLNEYGPKPSAPATPATPITPAPKAGDTKSDSKTDSKSDSKSDAHPTGLSVAPTSTTLVDTKSAATDKSNASASAASAGSGAAPTATATATAKSSGSGGSGGDGVRVTKLEWSVVPATAVSMDLFDRLRPDVVSESGYIKKCMEEIHDALPVADELRRTLLIEDSQYYGLYSDDERNQFLFRIFKNLCVRQSINQSITQSITQSIRARSQSTD